MRQKRRQGGCVVESRARVQTFDSAAGQAEFASSHLEVSAKLARPVGG